jgi:hypothetical protein
MTTTKSLACGRALRRLPSVICLPTTVPVIKHMSSTMLTTAAVTLQEWRFMIFDVFGYKPVK